MNRRYPFLKRTLTGMAAFCLCLDAQTPHSSRVSKSNDSWFRLSDDLIALPYAFSTDSTGAVGGIGIIKQGWWQPQTVTIGTLYYGTSQDVTVNGMTTNKHFSGGSAALFDYRIPGTQRWLFSILGSKNYFPKARYYLYDHDKHSDEKSYVETPGDTDFVYATLKYVLPLGEGKENPTGYYELRNGFPIGRDKSGGGIPFLTGRTSIGITAFYEHYTFDNYLPPAEGTDRSSRGLEEWNTNGLYLFLDHDNTDFDLNPSRGYQFKLQYSKDFGWGDSLQSWDFLSFKYNHYLSLPAFSFTQQNILAMSFWTGYSFSWDDGKQALPGIDMHRPPMWEGGRLGGMFRMRGYNTNRFSDRAVIYGTAEYRATLRWNPFRKSDYLPVAVDWLQLVGFVEAGNVNPSYNGELFENMKFDAGISLRAMAAHVPVRLDIAFSEESTNIWVMVFHPFDF